MSDEKRNENEKKRVVIEPKSGELHLTGGVPSMSKETDLVFLLEELFPSPENLRRFLYSLPIDSSEVPRVLAEASTKRIALWLVDELRRRGLVNADFFKRLVDERPNYPERIRQVQDQWGCRGGAVALTAVG